MNITLENVAVYIGIITFAAGLLKVLVITPLKDAIGRLESAIEKLSSLVAKQDARIDDHQERIAVVERDVRSAHKRIDHLESAHDSYHEHLEHFN